VGSIAEAAGFGVRVSGFGVKGSGLKDSPFRIFRFGRIRICLEFLISNFHPRQKAAGSGRAGEKIRNKKLQTSTKFEGANSKHLFPTEFDQAL
jgi:hypothetical protein